MMSCPCLYRLQQMFGYVITPLVGAIGQALKLQLSMRNDSFFPVC